MDHAINNYNSNGYDSDMNQSFHYETHFSEFQPIALLIWKVWNYTEKDNANVSDAPQIRSLSRKSGLD